MKLVKLGLILLIIPLIAYQAAVTGRGQKGSGNIPVISCDVDELQIPCQYEETELLQGLTAYDVEDGYITDQILVGEFSDFTERGVASLEYAVYDADGNMTTYNRKVVFSDYTPPRIMISSPWVFKPANNSYDVPSLELTAADLLDGDISRRLLITSEDMDFYEPGRYTASVSLKNSFGDEVKMDLPVHILERGLGGITIELTEPMIYVDQGAAVNPGDYIAAIRNEYTSETIPDTGYKLTINSNVDTSKDGIYEIQYYAVSPDQVQRGETWLTVVVGGYGG